MISGTDYYFMEELLEHYEEKHPIITVFSGFFTLDRKRYFGLSFAVGYPTFSVDDESNYIFREKTHDGECQYTEVPLSVELMLKFEKKLRRENAKKRKKIMEHYKMCINESKQNSNT